MAITIKKTVKLNLSKVPRNKRAEVKEEIAELLLDSVLEHVSEGKSPVQGERSFKGLSKEYKKVKSKISGSTKPNMELFGDMLDDLKAVADKGSSVSIGFMKDASEKSKLKAENHNKWTSRAEKTKVPKRRFIPKGEQEFKKDIMRQVNEIINDASQD